MQGANQGGKKGGNKGKANKGNDTGKGKTQEFQFEIHQSINLTGLCI